MVVVCDLCGIEFDKKISEINRTKLNFCSKECRILARKEKSWLFKRGKYVNCKVCGKYFYLRPKQINKDGNFCSRECYGSWRAVNVIGDKHPRYAGVGIEINCKECGKSFKRKNNNR